MGVWLNRHTIFTSSLFFCKALITHLVLCYVCEHALQLAELVQMRSSSILSLMYSLLTSRTLHKDRTMAAACWTLGPHLHERPLFHASSFPHPGFRKPTLDGYPNSPSVQATRKTSLTPQADGNPFFVWFQNPLSILFLIVL